ncbi:DedA family protein [Ramlibacter sp. AN1133]|uniref:DedA family protein n=1 Tax=Ramlibacter sp. AN1133 TaxID=3133429 RepID=UPI0030BC2202
MSLIAFVGTYGYLAVLLGTLLEGESILLLAGFAAHQGHLSLELVLLIAFFGGAVGDQVFFWIGRRWGGLLLARSPMVRERTARVGALLKRWDAALVFGIRFLYGLRIAGPVAMGALGVNAGRFTLFNALGAAVWAVVIGGGGYLLGHSLEVFLGDLQRYEGAIFGGALAVAALGFLAHRGLQHVRAKRLRRADAADAPHRR